MTSLSFSLRIFRNAEALFYVQRVLILQNKSERLIFAVHSSIFGPPVGTNLLKKKCNFADWYEKQRCNLGNNNYYICCDRTFHILGWNVLLIAFALHWLSNREHFVKNWNPGSDKQFSMNILVIQESPFYQQHSGPF